MQILDGVGPGTYSVFIDAGNYQFGWSSDAASAGGNAVGSLVDESGRTIGSISLTGLPAGHDDGALVKNVPAGQWSFVVSGVTQFTLAARRFLE